MKAFHRFIIDNETGQLSTMALHILSPDRLLLKADYAVAYAESHQAAQFVYRRVVIPRMMQGAK